MSLSASLVAQMGKQLPAVQKTQVWSLGQEDPLEKEMATHSSTLAWKIPWTEEPGRLQSMRLQSRTWLSNFNNKKMLFKNLYWVGHSVEHFIFPVLYCNT